MAIFELDALLEPIAGEAAAGPDLEHDSAFIELELKAQGSPEQVVRVLDKSSGQEVEKTIAGKDAEHRVVLPAALALFARTKDLRVAMHVLRAATCGHGLAGYAEASALIARLCERMWDEVHPQLDPDDELDPTMRINILAGYADLRGALGALRGAILAEARAVGRFTLRDLEVSHGDAGPLDGQQAATRELLLAACQALPAEELAARRAQCGAALADLAAIEALFQERCGRGPDFGAARKLLQRLAALYQDADGGAPEAAPAPADEGAAAGAMPAAAGAPAGVAPAPRGPGAAPVNRAEARHLLTQVCEFLERAEPAHPAPLLVRRAIRLLDMNFLDIMRELTPDAVREIEHLGGLKRED